MGSATALKGQRSSENAEKVKENGVQINGHVTTINYDNSEISTDSLKPTFMTPNVPVIFALGIINYT